MLVRVDIFLELLVEVH